MAWHQYESSTAISRDRRHSARKSYSPADAEAAAQARLEKVAGLREQITASLAASRKRERANRGTGLLARCP